MKKTILVLIMVAIMIACVVVITLELANAAYDREAEVRGKMRELTFEAAYIQERAKTIMLEATTLDAELDKIIKEKEAKKNEKKSK